LLYLGGAATRPDIGPAVIVDYDFALAHYFSAYLRIEDRDLAAAEKHIEAALALSPANPMFICEKAHLRQLAKDWTGSIELCDEAIESTAAFSPADARVREKTRALRTKAYSLVELKNTQEAKSLYIECLALDPNDRKAAAELRYIESLK
jgi:tetratricopeptide (TPR) repeat protein